MKKFKIIVVKKKNIYIAAFIAFVLLIALFSLFIHYVSLPVYTFADTQSRIIFIDPGHGGIDGGTNKDGILEKEVNLVIAKKLKALLEQKEYKVIMSREEDISLDDLNSSSKSRHKRDLNARVNIINNSKAQLFLSIHVNCNFKSPTTDGSIVFYNNKLSQNKAIAYSIQRALNSIVVNGKERTLHDPQQANFFVLRNSQVPGVLVEIAFISNEEEKKLLEEDEFREQLATAIADGVEGYLKEPSKVFTPINGMSYR